MKNKKRIKKSIIILATASILTFSSINLPMNTSHNYTYAKGLDSFVKIVIDNKEVKSDVAPIIKDGRTLVPARVISENLGFEVEWNKETRVATLSKDGVEYIAKIGEKKITTSDGREMKLDVPAQIVNRRTMLPLRAIVEISGASVEWDSKGKTVLVNSTGGPIEKPQAKPSNETKPSQAKEGSLITEASYNGKTVKITNKSWKVKNGDVWIKHTGEGNGRDQLVELFPEELVGDSILSFRNRAVKINSTEYPMIQEGEWTDITDAIRKSGGSSKVVGNKMVIDLHPDQASADRDLVLMEEGKKELEEWHKSIAHVPNEERGDRQFRMVNAIQIPSDLGFKLVEVRPYTNASLKDIKYAVKYIGDGNNAPQIVKNSGALKAGDKFVITSDNNSPSMGWKKGHYVFQIPSNAQAIHSSGDMRYGWTDSRYNDYAMKYLNAIRTNESDYEYDQSLRLPNVKLTAPIPAQMQWHKDQVIKQYGMKPQTFGAHGSKVTSHYQGGDARMEVLAHSHRNLSDWYKDINGNFLKSDGITTLLGSGTHAGIMLDRRYDDMSVQNIYRPDLTEITVMTFGR